MLGLSRKEEQLAYVKATGRRLIYGFFLLGLVVPPQIVWRGQGKQSK
jgi:hypothetical protein